MMTSKHQESLQQHQKKANQQRIIEPFSPLLGLHLSFNIIISLMTSKTSLAILLIAMLLADSLLAAKWQGTGSGMNNTVITEIWKDIESNLNQAFMSRTQEDFTKQISIRLNSKWDPAWNVVLATVQLKNDVIFYGYAFRSQWMWYNGVPNAFFGNSFTVSLIVWKDYNCRDWKSVVGDYGVSSLTATQKATIKAEFTKLTATQLRNDIWGSAFSMMTNILANSEFSSGGYSVIMSQDYRPMVSGYVCRVGYNHYHYNHENLGEATQESGNFYLFQTR